jgi:hypothetical protein
MFTQTIVAHYSPTLAGDSLRAVQRGALSYLVTIILIVLRSPSPYLVTIILIALRSLNQYLVAVLIVVLRSLNPYFVILIMLRGISYPPPGQSISGGFMCV